MIKEVDETAKGLFVFAADKTIHCRAKNGASKRREPETRLMQSIIEQRKDLSRENADNAPVALLVERNAHSAAQVLGCVESSPFSFFGPCRNAFEKW